MPVRPGFWTPARVERAIASLRATKDMARSVADLSAEWGERLTVASIGNAIRRSGVRLQDLAGEPSTYGSVTVNPIVNPERSTKEPVPQAVEHPDKTEHLLAWQRYQPRSNWTAPPEPGVSSSTAPAVERGVVIPDAHFPFVDRVAWACTLGILKEWQPHTGVIIGDFLDLESLSRHGKSRPDLVRLAGEFYGGNVALDALQSASPNTRWTFLEGNHCGRATRYANEFGMLDGLLSVPEQLFIAPRADAYHRNGDGNLRGMAWVPLSKQPHLTATAAYFHGVDYLGKHFTGRIAEEYVPAKGAGRRVAMSGHTHTFQMHTGRAGFVSQSVGFLGDERSSVFSYATGGGKPTGWQLGIVLQTTTADGLLGWECVRIEKGRAIFGGGRTVAAALED